MYLAISEFDQNTNNIEEFFANCLIFTYEFDQLILNYLNVCRNNDNIIAEHENNHLCTTSNKCDMLLDKIN
jgi:hypothetical protein